MVSSPPVKEQRRSARYQHELLVELHERHGSRRLYAVDVARHGLFIATPDPPRERHLVQLTVHLPTGAIRAAASVTRSLKGRRDHADGVGVQFFALSEDAKSRWDDFIFALQRTTPPKGTFAPEPSGSHPPAPAVPLPGASTATSQPPAAEPASVGATFLVKLKTVERLREFQQTHLASGGTVLFTPVLRAPGEHLTLIVVHPKSDEEFRLPGVVHKAHGDRPKRLEIHFLGMNPALLNNFAAFVESGQPPRVQLLTPPTPPAIAAEEKDLDLDVQVWDEIWDDVTLDTDDEEIARAVGDVTAPPKAKPASDDFFIEPPQTPPLVAPLPEEDKPVLAAPLDDKPLSHDPGLQPEKYVVSCDQTDCRSERYTVELGPCRGLLGLVADYDAFVSQKHDRVVSSPRLISAEERKARKERFLANGGRLDLTVDLSMFFSTVDLIEPAVDEDGKPLKRTRAIERMDAAARKLEKGDEPAKTKVQCPSCKDGHLTIGRA